MGVGGGGGGMKLHETKLVQWQSCCLDRDEPWVARRDSESSQWC
jgi:hypothetical protein